MKIKLLLTSVLFIFCLESHSQFAVGPKIGVNFNSFRGNKAFDVVPGFSVGGFIKYKALDFLSGRAEILYFQQGANIIDYRLMSDLRRNHAYLHFHTIQVPLMVELGLPSLADEPLQPKILLGAFYSYVLSAQEPHENEAMVGGYPSIRYKGYSTVTDQFNRKQYGFVLGAAADIVIMSLPVSLEFRYNQNVNPISKGSTRTAPNLTKTFDEWGNTLYLGTVSFNIAVTLQYF